MIFGVKIVFICTTDGCFIWEMGDNCSLAVESCRNKFIDLCEHAHWTF